MPLLLATLAALLLVVSPASAGPKGGGGGGGGKTKTTTPPPPPPLPPPPPPVEGAVHVDRDSVGGSCSDGRSAVEATNPATPLCSIARGLVAVPDGGTLSLRRATYPDTTVTGIRKASTTTVTPFPGETPVLEGLTVADCSNLHFQGLHFRYTKLQGCSDVAYTGGEFTGLGFWAWDSQRITYANVFVHDAIDGITLRRSSDVTITGNRFRGIPSMQRVADGGDGVQAHTVQRVRIVNNDFDECRTHPHADAVHLFLDNSDVAIEGNVFHRCRGPIVSPTYDGPQTNTGFVIANNELTTMKSWALNLHNLQGARIVNNTAWGSTLGAQLLGAWSRDNVVAGNIANVLKIGDPSMVAVEDYNLVTAGTRLGAHDLAGTPVFADAAAGDYTLKASSPGVDASTSEGTPTTDRLGRARVDLSSVPNLGALPASHYDMGAYETQP